MPVCTKALYVSPALGSNSKLPMPSCVGLNEATFSFLEFIISQEAETGLPFTSSILNATRLLTPATRLPPSGKKFSLMADPVTTFSAGLLLLSMLIFFSVMKSGKFSIHMV